MSMIRLRWMMSLMGCSLIALIFFQWQWIAAAVDTNEDRFQTDVMESMAQVVKKLERQEVLQLVNQQIKNPGLGTTTYQSKQESISYYYGWSDSSEVQEQVNVSIAIDAFGNVVYDMGQLPRGTSPESTSGKEFNQSVQVLEDTVAQLRASLDELEQIKNNQLQKENQMVQQTLAKMNSKSQLLVTVLEEMMYSRPLELRITPEVIDSLLTEELSERGISIPFEFGVWKPNPLIWFTGQTNGRQKEIFQSAYVINLFPNDLFDNPQKLSVIFPTKDGYLSGKLWINMISSGVLLMVILISFGYSIYTILRQKKLSEMKTDFINNMTHEFKTPIATIGLAVEALQDKALADVQDFRERYIGVIGDENKRLGNQVEKVLQMAIVDRREMKLHLEQTDIHEVIDRAIDKIKLQLEKRGGEIQCVTEASPSNCLLDATQMMHVMLNLLDNAIKYSMDAPKILVRTSANRKQVKVSVKDHGVGMSREAQKHIFQSFYRVSTGNLHDVKGFGLGLSFVKNIIAEHHGEVTVESEPGRGTNISFTIPLNTHE